MAEDSRTDITVRQGYNLPVLIGLGVLLVLSIVYIIYAINRQNSLIGQALTQKQQIDSLQEENELYLRKVTELDDRAFALDKKVQELSDEKERLINARDSVQRLLTYARTREQNAQGKIAQLQKQLKDLQTKLNDVQSKYDDLLASSGTSSDALQRQVEQLTAERNSLAQENQRLQRELLTYAGNADNRTAIFTTSMSAIPGEIKRDRFSPSKRSQNADRVQVSFTLSRPPRPTENLIFKVYNPQGQEITIKPRYRNELNAPEDPTNQQAILEFERGFLIRGAEGQFSVRLYLTDVNKGIENQEIGIAQFELK